MRLHWVIKRAQKSHLQKRQSFGILPFTPEWFRGKETEDRWIIWSGCENENVMKEIKKVRSKWLTIRLNARKEIEIAYKLVKAEDQKKEQSGEIKPVNTQRVK